LNIIFFLSRDLEFLAAPEYERLQVQVVEVKRECSRHWLEK